MSSTVRKSHLKQKFAAFWQWIWGKSLYLFEKQYPYFYDENNNHNYFTDSQENQLK